MTQDEPGTVNCTTEEITSVFDRVFNAVERARRELSSTAEGTALVRSTRQSFRKRQRSPRGNTGMNIPWRCSPFLLSGPTTTVPSVLDCERLTNNGLGQADCNVRGSTVDLIWSLATFNNYICQCYPNIALNLIGFRLAKANKSRKLKIIEVSSVQELKEKIGRSKLYIIPNAVLTLPSQGAAVTITGPDPVVSTGPTSTSSTGPAPASSMGPAPASSMGPAPASSTGPAPASSTGPAPAMSSGPSAVVCTGPAQVVPPRPASVVSSGAAAVVCTGPAPSLSVCSSPNSSGNQGENEEWINGGTANIYLLRPRDGNVDATCTANSEELIIIESEEEEDENEDILAESFPLFHEQTLEEVLKKFIRDNITGDTSTIVVRRRHLLKDAVSASRKTYFSWQNLPLVQFVGEEANDYGGPRREFFRILMQKLVSSYGVFEGSPGRIVFTYDQNALEQEKYRTAGKMIAWSLAHDGPGIRSLEPALYQLMCTHKADLEFFDIQYLPDVEVQQKIRQIRNCCTEEDVVRLKQDLGDWIADCGVPGVYSAKLEDMAKMASQVVKHYIFHRTGNMIAQFIEGMNACSNMWSLVETNWIAFLPVFTAMTQPLSRAEFRDLIEVCWSPQGSNKREEEEATILCWEGFLMCIQEKDTDVTFEELLIFCTGADAIPPLGFSDKLRIDFYDQTEGCRLPYASTCSMVLFLPRGVEEEEEFTQIMKRALRDSIGFGKV